MDNEFQIPDQIPVQTQKSNNNFMNFIRQNKWAFWLILVSILVIGALVFFIFRKSGSGAPTNPQVSVNIDAPASVPSGQQIVYKVTIQNKESTTIKSIELDMLYPQGFTFSDSTPTPTSVTGNNFQVPDIAPGQNAVIMIKGNIYGNANEVKSITAIAHYQFSNFNSNFIAQAQSKSQITNSSIVLNFNGSNTNINDQTSTYTVSYSNTTSSPIPNIKIKLTIPDTFMVVSSNPQLDKQDTLTIPSLDPNQTAQIEIVGKFHGANVGDQQIFVAEADGPDQTGQTVALSVANYNVTMIASPLSATMTVTDQNAQGQSTADVISPGDNIHIDIDYKNNGQIALTGVQVSTTLTGSAIDLSSISAETATVSNNIISWNASQVPDFQSLAPNQEGHLLLNFNIKNPATHGSNVNMNIFAQTQIKSSEYQEGFVSNSDVLKIKTIAALTGSVAYSSGAQPPQNGKSTVYRVTVAASNSTNDVDNAVLTLNLPNSNNFDASTINAAEGSNVTYDHSTRKLTWNIGKLLAHTGDFNALRKLTFTVVINPGATDVGQTMTLANNIVLIGTDDYTQTSINTTIQDLTTNDDPSGQGVVQ